MASSGFTPPINGSIILLEWGAFLIAMDRFSTWSLLFLRSIYFVSCKNCGNFVLSKTHGIINWPEWKAESNYAETHRDLEAYLDHIRINTRLLKIEDCIWSLSNTPYSYSEVSNHILNLLFSSSSLILLAIGEFLDE